jgi:hypothetical protein
MKFQLVRTLNGFKFAHDSDLEKGRKIKVGDFVNCDIKKPRNYMFHKKFFALVELVFQNQDLTDDKDNLRAYLTVKAGFYETITSDIGVMYLPKSISFAKMDEIEFEELFIKFLNVSSMLIGVDNGDIIDEIAQFL